MSQQLKDLVNICPFFSLSLDESTGICVVAQLSIYIYIYEEWMIISVSLENFSVLSRFTEKQADQIYSTKNFNAWKFYK